MHNNNHKEKSTVKKRKYLKFDRDKIKVNCGI